MCEQADMTPYDAQLRECLITILALRHRGVTTSGQCATLHQSLRDGLDRLMDRAFTQAVPRVQARDALFALCAFADEVGLAQPVAETFWRQNRLSTYYFQPLERTSSFYSRLATVLRAPQAEVLRAYYYCLTLGYEGEHRGVVGAAARASLVAQIRPLLGAPPPMLTGSSLEPVAKPGVRWNTLWIPAVALGVGLGLYLLLSALVQRDASNYVNAIEALLQNS